MATGDTNNDGIPEILSAGEFGPVTVLSWKKNTNTFSSTLLPANMYAQGSSTVDVNRDGWLDYFLANDVGYSRFYVNDGKGNLQFQQLIDFSKGDPTDGSGNYGIEWTDVNADGRPDLYISKCRAGVENPQDPRRINRLYIQQPDGTFQDKAADYGVASGDQSWAATFGDLDNDGDPDLFLANHYAPHQLYENINGTYFNKVNMGPPLQSFVFQLAMRDFDNDGLLDIMYSGAEGATLLHNRGQFRFDRINRPLGPNLMRSFTCGDINEDGFVDIHAHLGEPINKVGPKPDELWLGIPNENQYIRIALAGKGSNASGVGTRLLLHGPWGRQFRYVSGGQGYGVANSLIQHFGLGPNTKADSLEVFWPSGIRDVYYNLKAGKTYLAQERLCLSERYVWSDDTRIISENAPASLIAPGGFSSYEWSNGKTGQQLLVGEGVWHVRMTAQDGCLTISEPVQVLQGCFQPGRLLLTDTSFVVACEGQPFVLNSVPAVAWAWSTGDTTQSVQVIHSGWVSVRAQDYCGNTKFDSVFIQFSRPELSILADPVSEGERTVLRSSQKATLWFADENLDLMLGAGDTLLTNPLYQSVTYYAKAEVLVSSQRYRVGEQNFPPSNLYGANSVSGGLVFDVSEPCIIKTIKVNTDTRGIRTFVILGNDGKPIFRKDILLLEGISVVELNASVNPGEGYVMTTDELVNLSQLGYKSPRLVRTFNQTRFPYEINDILTIQSSTFGALYYYYFYDWEVESNLISCETDVMPVLIVVTPSSTYAEEEPQERLLSPNPAFDRVFLRLPENTRSATCYTAHGYKMATIAPEQNELDISAWPPGMYYLQIYTTKNATRRYFFKL